jgi:hypothetical protein
MRMVARDRRAESVEAFAAANACSDPVLAAASTSTTLALPGSHSHWWCVQFICALTCRSCVARSATVASNFSTLRSDCKAKRRSCEALTFWRVALGRPMRQSIMEGGRNSK